MSKNAHTYTEKLNVLWDQMCHTCEYLIRSNGRDWFIDNCSEVIKVDYDNFIHFSGTADETAAAVDELVLKAQRKWHNDPNYTF